MNKLKIKQINETYRLKCLRNAPLTQYNAIGLAHEFK